MSWASDSGGLGVCQYVVVFAAGPWPVEATPLGQTLEAVVRGRQGDPDVTVAAGGTVLET